VRVTTKTHYATIALIELCLRRHKGLVPLPEIAESQNISPSYLEQLFTRLKRKGLVTSVRGRCGGYKLGRSPDEISIACIADAVDESMDTTRCHGQSDCQGGETCLTHYLWTDLSDHIHHFLDSITLSDLVQKLPSAPDDDKRIPSRML